MTKDTPFQHGGVTLPSPTKHVVGVFDSLQEGEQAVQALMDAGFHAEDIALIPGQDFLSAFQKYMRNRGWFGHMMHRLQVKTDEGSLDEWAVAAARQGCYIITIHMPKHEHIDDVGALLFNHGACQVKYVGNWSITDLYPPIKSGKG